MRSVAFREGNAPAPESGRPAVLTSRDGLCSLRAKPPAQEDTGPGCRERVPSVPLLTSSLSRCCFGDSVQGSHAADLSKLPGRPGSPLAGQPHLRAAGSVSSRLSTHLGLATVRSLGFGEGDSDFA